MNFDLIQQRVLRWQRQLMEARLKLAEPDLPPEGRAELQQVIDRCEWALRMLNAAGFPAELDQVDHESEARVRQPLH